MIINGKIKKEITRANEREYDYISVEFSVEELMRNNTPYTNFWAFCLMYDLIRKKFPDLEYDPDDPDCDEYVSTIDTVILTYSEDKEKNRIVEEMFKKLDIFTI